MPGVALEGRTGLLLAGGGHRRWRGRGPGEAADDLGRRISRRGVDLRGGVLAGFDVADDLAAGRHDQGVDPDHVALVPVGLHPDHLVLALGRLDHLVPGEARRGGVDAGRLRGRLAVPEQLGVGPERRRHELVVPVGRLQRALEDAVGEGGLVLLGERTEEAGVGELRDERRVEAHHVDRAVLGGQPADQLLPLVGRRRSAASGCRPGRHRSKRRRTSRRGVPARRCPG